MKFAPVIIPTLNRYEHFKVCVESLKKNLWAKYTDIFVGVDYPPSDKYKEGWKNICDYLETSDFSIFHSFNVIKREFNFGAGNNTEDMRKQVFKKYDRYIYLEDDIEVSPNFLEYIDKSLDKYESDDSVVAVCGYSYPIKWDVSDGATCLKQNVNCFMWGTGFWRSKYLEVRKWMNNCESTKLLPKVIKGGIYLKMTDAAKIDYFSAASRPWDKRKTLVNKSSDIGIRIYLSIANKYAICPVLSKTRNHGFDGSGLYCQKIDDKTDGTTSRTLDYDSQPIDDSPNFELIEDTKHNDIRNHDITNNFDSRTPEELSEVNRQIGVCKKLGIISLYIYTIFIGICKRIKRKTVRH